MIGDSDAQRVLDAAFFYIQSSVHASTRTGMPPFGLSQFSYYYGHSFWDTETWSLLPVILTAPEAARSLLEYRVRALDYAKRQAALYGYRGAQFPWEAAPIGGFETTPTFAGTGWGEQHVTADVALGFWEYQLATNDLGFLPEGTWPVLKAVAEWIESRGVYSERGFEIRHVMGPDEDVPNISNVSYMNLVCKMVLTARTDFLEQDSRCLGPTDRRFQKDSSALRQSAASVEQFLFHGPTGFLDSSRYSHRYRAFEKNSRIRRNNPPRERGFVVGRGNPDWVCRGSHFGNRRLFG